MWQSAVLVLPTQASQLATGITCFFTAGSLLVLLCLQDNSSWRWTHCNNGDIFSPSLCNLLPIQHDCSWPAHTAQRPSLYGEQKLLLALSGNRMKGLSAGRFIDQDISLYDKSMQLIYFGTLYVAKALIPAMVQRKSGHLLFVISPLAAIGADQPSPHCVR